MNRRNGYRAREFDTRAGTLELQIPKLWQSTYFPEWLLERRKRAERTLTSVVATCYLLGVSIRRMDKLVQSLGITSPPKSQVSDMARELAAHVEQFRTRPLADAGPFTFVADGHWQVLGMQRSPAARTAPAGWRSSATSSPETAAVE